MADKSADRKIQIEIFAVGPIDIVDDIKEFITEQEIKLPSGSNQSLSFDYFSFCRSINVDTINNIISIGSTLGHNQFFMQQKFYFFFMRKCPELKYFDMKSIKHQIFYFPEAMIRLESLCELKCNTSIDSSYFYGLSQFCQYIQRLIIINTDTKSNHGIVRLIEVQKNLKHFEWEDYFHEELFMIDNLYDKIFLALEKKAESLNYLKIFFLYTINYEHILLQKILPKFYKLKILIIESFLHFDDEQLEKLKMQVYHELEILDIGCNMLNLISSIIKNSGGCLKKILFKPYDVIDNEVGSFKENSLKFIREIYKNCPSIEYLTIIFPPSEVHFAEFEKLLKICQNLKSLLLISYNVDEIETEERLENGEILLEILIRSAPSNLKEIRFSDDDLRFSLENFEEFLEKWKGRHALSIFTIDSYYITEDYTKLINKYKSDGVIKDFKYFRHIDSLSYCV
ncbi:13480_t:CDS:2 [Rhizophagus irregularis]|nr:13480_t:CDS:2 [Rhizophagus irregularis]